MLHSVRRFNPAQLPYISHQRALEEVLLKKESLGVLCGHEVVGHMRGGMGEILIVKKRDEKEIQLDVLKTVAHEWLDFDKAFLALAEEAVVALRLKNSWIMPVSDVLREPYGGKNRLFLKMPYATGGSLRQRIEYGEVRPEETIYYLLCVTESLSVMHGDGFVHRDLKPENILLEIRKDEYMPRIADFGLSQHINRLRAGTPFTGTLLYAAPEQLSGLPVSEAADVWALGVIVLELLSGTHPYLQSIMNLPTEAIADRLSHILHKTSFQMACENVANGYPWLADLVASMLGIKPSARPTSAQILEVLSNKISFSEKKESGIVFVGCNPKVCDFCYPLSSHIALSLARHYGWLQEGPGVWAIFDMGWASRMKRAHDLIRLDTYSSYKTAIHNLDETLGDPTEPSSVLAQFLQNPRSQQYCLQNKPEVGVEKRLILPVPGTILLELLDLKIRCLVDIVERYAFTQDIELLKETCNLWKRANWLGLSQAELNKLSIDNTTPGEVHLCRVAQGFYYTDDYEQAEAAITSAQSVLGHHLLVDSLLHLIYTSTDRYGEALEHSTEMIEYYVKKKDSHWFLHWLNVVALCYEDLGYVDKLGELVAAYPTYDSFHFVTGKIIWQGRTGRPIENSDHRRIENFKCDFGDPTCASLMVEVYWYFGDKALAQKIASYCLTDRRCCLRRHRKIIPILQAVSQGQGMFYVDTVDFRGATALHHAARGGHIELVKELLRFGWDPQQKDVDGFTPRDHALANKKQAAADLLG